MSYANTIATEKMGMSLEQLKEAVQDIIDTFPDDHYLCGDWWGTTLDRNPNGCVMDVNIWGRDPETDPTVTILKMEVGKDNRLSAVDHVVFAFLDRKTLKVKLREV